MITTEDAKLRAETLVSRWHAKNRQYLGQGYGIDWQARKALIEDVAEALCEPGNAVEQHIAAADGAQLRRRKNRGAEVG